MEFGIGEIFACAWNPESEKFLLVELGILGFPIRNTAQGIQNPSSTDKDGNPVPGIHNPWRGIQSKTTLDSLTWGDNARRIRAKRETCDEAEAVNLCDKKSPTYTHASPEAKWN